MGNPADVNPQRTEIPGTPARSAPTVKTSFKYMESGSSFSPCLNATLGVVGATITSTRATAIGIVVAGGERVGPEHDPALDLGAEAGGARPADHVDQVFATGHAEAVLDAIVAGQVRRGLGGRDDVVHGDPVVRHGQRDLF